MSAESDEIEKKVAILGMWYAHNYGAVMTSYALYSLLSDMGYSPAFVDHTGHESIPDYCRSTRTVFRQFIEGKGLATTKTLSNEEDFLSLNEEFSTFLVGSDQLWRHRYTWPLKMFYFLDFVYPRKRRIAFGTSIGTSPCVAPQEFRDEASALLTLFTGISSREREGCDVLRKQYNAEAHFVLDPVFLCKKEHYIRCSKDCTRPLPDGDYVLSYFMDPSRKLKELVDSIAEMENASKVIMLDVGAFEQKKRIMGSEDVIDNLTPDEWIRYIMNCKHFITDSFHGLCFALIFNKPFTVVANKQRGYSRFTSLLEEVHMREYLLEDADDWDRVRELPPINWSVVNNVIRMLQEQSVEWLSSMLKKDPLKSNHGIEYLLMKLKKLEIDYSKEKESLVADQKLYLSLIEKLRLVSMLPSFRRKYYKYRLLSKIAVGKRRKLYKEQSKTWRELLSSARAARREIGVDFMSH